jgi:hypothetical protein
LAGINSKELQDVAVANEGKLAAALAARLAARLGARFAVLDIGQEVSRKALVGAVVNLPDNEAYDLRDIIFIERG